jgi:23S rRNA (cytidine1920-2'-O)/16S rRNA (cytidine1409-2'-O)-methyltransferase
MTDFSKSVEERRHFSVKEVCSYLKIPYNNVLKEISYTNLTKALEYFGENKTATDGSYNPKRIDIELTKRGLTRSRTKAQELIEGGYVLCNGELVDKKSHLVSGIDNITIIDNETLKYVSRGGLKLEKAIEEFNIDFFNKKIMDVGSSTGGFTDCALQHGAKEVVAIDVGRDQMDRELRDNPKVKLYEGTHIKDVPLSFFEDVDYITIDVSFISLTKVYEKIAESRVNVEVISLIKPQFECGKKIATKYRGMILDKKVHKSVLEKVIKKINNLGFFVKNLTSSPVRGGDGNIEYISYFTNKSSHNSNIEIAETVNKAFNLPRE